MKLSIYLLLLTSLLSLEACRSSKKTIVNAASLGIAAKTLALEPDKYHVEFEKGIDLIASGNEPFWSLEIDFDKYMHFKTPDGIDITTPSVTPVKAMDADVIRCTAETGTGALIIQLFKKECINDMSGEKFPFTVTVERRMNTEKEFTVYKGCGQNLMDYRLHDIWVLDSVDGQKADVAFFPTGLPRLEFNLTEGTITGYSGCNDINGPVFIMGKKMIFGDLLSTNNTCPDLSERSYLEGLSGKTVNYFTYTLKLYLQFADGKILVFKKVD
jgi:heat shock protein HslJ